MMRVLQLPYSAAQEMFRRMVFNVVIRNQDDHTKNISFLMGENGRWRLSPAYDMGYAYNPNGGWTAKHQMSVAGKFDSITKADLMGFAKANNIKDASEVIEKIVEETEHWPYLARECEVPAEMVDRIFSNMCTRLR